MSYNINQVLVYLLVLLIIIWSISIYIKGLIETNKIKKIKSLYPNGFMYEDEAYFAVRNHENLPTISDHHLELLNSIDKSFIEKASDGKVSISIPNPSTWW